MESAAAACRLAISPTPAIAKSSLASTNSIFFTSCNEPLKAAIKISSNLNNTSVDSAVARRRRRNGDFRCMFGLGVPELAVIAGVAALVFGPKKIPDVGRSLAQTVKSFQQAAKEFETELKKDAENANSAPAEAEETKAIDSKDDEEELATASSKRESA